MKTEFRMIFISEIQKLLAYCNNTLEKWSMSNDVND